LEVKIPREMRSDFHLVEPRGIGGRVMDLHPGVGLQEGFDRLGFVGGKIVGDDINVLVRDDSGDHLV